MGRKASSIAHRKRVLRAEYDTRMGEALAFHKAQQSLPEGQRKSNRQIASTHRLSPSTFGRLLKGGVSISEFNAKKRHLPPAEERVVIKFLLDNARRGLPLNHRLLRDKVNAILAVRKGPSFRVGKSWVSRFLEIHSDQLATYYTNPLDRSRSSGLNPVAVGWYFDTLEALAREHNIPTENWYAADESCMSLGVSATAEVIGPAGQRMQHQQQDGEREIVTV